MDIVGYTENAVYRIGSSVYRKVYRTGLDMHVPKMSCKMELPLGLGPTCLNLA